MRCNTHLKELVNTEATDINDSCIKFRDRAIKYLPEDVVMAPLHADSSIEQFSRKTFVPSIEG
jgi:hypothetical protein